MADFRIRLADKTVAVSAIYDSTRDFCSDYLTDTTPDFSVTVSECDITAEAEKSKRERELEGLAPYEFPPPYLETLALYRKIADKMLDYNTVLFHGSALEMDREAYIFTARSGTGKSTHTALWRKLYGERVRMINDDKPLLHIGEDRVTVYGTPWCGKHGLGSNISAPLRAVCFLTRAAENTICECSRTDALVRILQQIYRVSDTAGIEHDDIRILILLGRQIAKPLQDSCELFRLVNVHLATKGLYLVVHSASILKKYTMYHGILQGFKQKKGANAPFLMQSTIK